jgi:hypothetical protein
MGVKAGQVVSKRSQLVLASPLLRWEPGRANSRYWPDTPAAFDTADAARQRLLGILPEEDTLESAMGRTERWMGYLEHGKWRRMEFLKSAIKSRTFSKSSVRWGCTAVLTPTSHSMIFGQSLTVCKADSPKRGATSWANFMRDAFSAITWKCEQMRIIGECSVVDRYLRTHDVSGWIDCPGPCWMLCYSHRAVHGRVQAGLRR